MFCEVERSYIEDGFNLYGLRACVPNFSDCLDLMLDRIGPDDSDDSRLTQSACTLYGLIHARYIITAHGLDAMYNKYAAKEFGTCPLLQCGGQPVLPVGVKDEVGVDTVKVFCPKCQNIYHPPPIRSRGGSCTVDGASFGTTFPHLFLMTFSNLVPDGLSSDSVYVPRVFGFRVHQSARQRNGSMNSSTTTIAPSPQLTLKGSTRTAITTTAAASSIGRGGVGNAQSQQASEKVLKGLPDGPVYADTTTGVMKVEIEADTGTAQISGKNEMGNGNTSGGKRKSKLSSSSERIISNVPGGGGGDGMGRGHSADNGEGSLKTKTKRQRRPGNGVT